MSAAEKNIRLLKWFNFFLDFQLAGPIFILYFTQISGSFALGLAVFSVQTIAAAVFEVPTGLLSDFLGRKKTMLAGSAASILGLVLYALGGNFSLLILGSVFLGLSFAFFSGNNNALLYDTLQERGAEKNYGAMLGKVSAMFQWGLAAAALLGGFIAEWSFTLVMWIAVIPQVITLFIALQIREPQVHTDKIDTNIFQHLSDALRRFFKNIRLRTLSLASILDFGIGETMHQFIPVFYAMVLPVWSLGIVRMLSHINAALGFSFSGKILQKFTPLKALLGIGILSRAVGISALSFPTVFSPFLLTTTSFFFGVERVAIDSLLQEEFTHQQRATMGSLNAFAGSIFFAVFAVGFGVLADRIGPINALLVGQLFLLGINYFYLKLFRSTEPVVL